VEVALVHDYITQRGGAERVVLAMLRALGEVPVFTSLYEPDSTFREFRQADIRTSPLNHIPLLRKSHRLALPLLAPTFSRLKVDADLAICSSSGWAHGARVSGKRVVYCHAPARWLYQRDRYSAPRSPGRAALAVLGPPLERWDRAAARSATRYLANSRAVAQQVREIYGIDAEVLPPPPGLTPEGEREAIAGIEPGFILCVTRLQRYKNVDAVVDAFRRLPEQRLVVAGDGPDADSLRRSAPGNVSFLGPVADAQLRWLYAACAGTVSAAHEDFGLVPVEAASFGRPTAALAFGGFLDTVEEGATGVFFQRPEPELIAEAIRNLIGRGWDESELVHGAARFAEPVFANRLREIVGEISGGAS
jgi:glycosyltransferase involved in cell wall biosynthesis